MLYWYIGHTINKEILKNNRAEYGKQIIASLARQLTQEYGSSFSEKNLRRMIQFAEVFSNKQIVASLRRLFLIFKLFLSCDVRFLILINPLTIIKNF